MKPVPLNPPDQLSVRPQPPVRTYRRLLPLMIALFGLFLAACGGGGAGGADNAAVSTAAEAQGSLTNTGDLRTIEVLDVATGNATTLADTVTGDRAVLLWFYAPH